MQWEIASILIFLTKTFCVILTFYGLDGRFHVLDMITNATLVGNFNPMALVNLLVTELYCFFNQHYQWI